MWAGGTAELLVLAIVWSSCSQCAGATTRGLHAPSTPDLDRGPDDNEDDIRPWPCPRGMTWQRCAVNLTCFDDSDEEAVAGCGPGCYCPKRRFLLQGTCVAKDQCPPEDCGEDMKYSDCGNYCRDLCPGFVPPTSCRSAICYDGCFCVEGMKRFAGQCYKPEDCPKEPAKEMENFLLFNSLEPTSQEEQKRSFFKGSFPRHH